MATIIISTTKRAVRPAPASRTAKRNQGLELRPIHPTMLASKKGVSSTQNAVFQLPEVRLPQSTPRRRSRRVCARGRPGPVPWTGRRSPHRDRALPLAGCPTHREPSTPCDAAWSPWSSWFKLLTGVGPSSWGIHPPAPLHSPHGRRTHRLVHRLREPGDRGPGSAGRHGVRLRPNRQCPRRAGSGRDPACLRRLVDVLRCSPETDPKPCRADRDPTTNGGVPEERGRHQDGRRRHRSGVRAGLRHHLCDLHRRFRLHAAGAQAPRVEQEGDRRRGQGLHLCAAPSCL